MSSHFTFDGLDVEVDLSSQVLELEADAQLPREDLLAHSERARRSARDWELESAHSLKPYLYPTLTHLDTQWGWVPAMAFARKAKSFDDGLYAAVDLLAQKGTPRLPGRRRIVEHVHRTLRSRWRPESSDPLRSVLAVLGAALSMTGTLEEPDTTLHALVAWVIQSFESNEGQSKPLGFYTWNSQLQALFKQDRLLQTEWPPDAAGLLLQVIQSNERLHSAWWQQLRLLGLLTNSLSKPALDEEGTARCFFPPSDSPEGRLMKELFGASAPPEGFQLVDELISRLRAGLLDTTPTSRSGWYDHQFHAMVPFLTPEWMPEAERLRIGPYYRAELEQQFRALFALTRETHIKQLEELFMGDAGQLVISPQLSIEPIAEFYRRRAEGYLFLRQVLCELLGEESLAHTRRVLPTGTAKEPLLDELMGMEQLFRGAHAIVRQELGFEEVPPAVLPAAQVTRHWLGNWKEDPDLSQDPRCVVPLFFDLSRQKTKVTTVLGFHSTAVNVRFLHHPTVQLTDQQGRRYSSSDVEFTDSRYLTMCPVTAELYVDRVPDRAEFQALCDQHSSPSAILDRLRR